MSKELEAFVNDIRKAIKSIPSKPSITLKNANIVGIKLNSKSLKQLESETHSQTLDINDLSSPGYLMGIRIYKDESVDAPRYIVEGEIEVDNTSLSEALEDLEQLAEMADNCWVSCDVHKWKNTIKQALFKAQKNEEDKVFLKNLHNTNVKVPLVSIFNGLSKEKRFAYTEHIYYHWEEMKEALEAEIEDIKTEKENLELKAQEQEKVLSIIKEKRVNVDLFWNDFIDNGFGYHYYLEKWYKYQSTDKQKLTEEEFDLLKRWLG